MENFDDLYSKYNLIVYKYLLSLCKDAQIAEELCQETFYQAIKSVDSYNGTCKFYVWLCQISKNLWYKEIRQRIKHPEFELKEDIVQDSFSIEDSMIQKADKLLLYKALHKLTYPMQEVMYLRLTDEISFREIGENF